MATRANIFLALFFAAGIAMLWMAAGCTCQCHQPAPAPAAAPVAAAEGRLVVKPHDGQFSYSIPDSAGAPGYAASLGIVSCCGVLHEDGQQHCEPLTAPVPLPSFPVDPCNSVLRLDGGKPYGCEGDPK